jgi:hypothetical protein
MSGMAVILPQLAKELFNGFEKLSMGALAIMRSLNTFFRVNV